MGVGRGFKTSMHSNPKHSISRVSIAAVMLIIAVSILGPYGNSILRSGGAVVLCGYEKTDVKYGMELSGFRVMGSENLTVGGFVVVFFNLKYVGISHLGTPIQQITLRRVYVVAVKPSGNRVEYEDRSFRGRTMYRGDSISFHKEITPLDEKGVWTFWPAFEYSYVFQDKVYVVKSDDPWHECRVEVYEKTPTTTTTTPPPQLPDLMLSPRWHTGDRILFYDRCQGFRIYVWNRGNVSTGRSTTVEFSVTSLATGATWRLEGVLPQLGPGEEVAIYSGIFIGVPNNSYRIRVRIDPGNLITEASELNNERVYTQTYERANLPWVDLEVRNLSLTTDGVLRFRVRRNGCLNSPPTMVHLGVQVGYSQNSWLPTVIELASMRLDRMVGVDEVELSFTNVLNLLRNNAELQAMQAQYAKLNLWIDPVAVELPTVEGQSVTVDEFTQNNRAELVLGGKPMILGPRLYFLPRGRETYTIRNPTQIWSALSGALISGLPTSYSFSVQGCGASVSYNPQNPVELTIRVPGGCIANSITLSVTVENIGLRSTLDVHIYFYEVGELRLVQNPLIPASCASLSELGASQAFIFTDIPAGISYSPAELMGRVWWVTGIHPNGTVITEYRNARITVTISWITPSGRRDTYTIPSNDIRRISHDGRTFIAFTIPRNVVFLNIDTKAVSGEISIEIVTGSNQNVYSRVLPVWIHDSVTYPVYLRSFHLENTQCPYIDWDMWTEFWGEDAVYDTFGPWRWHDFASDFLYNIFTEMCSHGRCSAYALVSQKFANDPPAVIQYENVVCRPAPFTLNMSSNVRMLEPLPSRSFRGPLRLLNSYITYQYMWSLDERNLRRGATKFARWIRGDDIVLETLNELRQWERLPEDVKWRNVPLLFMFDDVIENSHTVLVYKVEEIMANYVRVWVIDSNRPFQPNSAANQDNSYVDFRCCTSDRHWYFRFCLDDACTRVINYFLFATNSSLFYGESAAFTELDAIDMLSEFLRLMITMGATGTSEESESRASENAPALITIRGDAGIRLREVSDSYGKKVAVFGSSTPPSIDNISGSVLAIPIPAPMANPAYMFVAGNMLNMVIEPAEQGSIFIAAGDANRTLEIQYKGQSSEAVNLGITQDSVRVENSMLRDFRVTSLVIDRNLTHQIALRINTARHTFNISFSPIGSFTVCNRGGSPITMDMKFIRYGDIDQQNISYRDVTVSPGDTIIASPRTWDNLGSGELLVKIDIGSDGSIDIERILNTEGKVITETVATQTRTTTTETETTVTPTVSSSVQTTSTPPSTTTSIATTFASRTTTPIETPTITTTATVTKETSTTLSRWTTPQLFIIAVLALIVLITTVLLIGRRR